MSIYLRKIVKKLSRRFTRRNNSDDSCNGDLTESCVSKLTKELAEQSGRVPPEARADLAITQARLTRLSVPDEDPEQTLLLWLARRGFHDVLALRADAGFQRLTERKWKGLDLCLWVDSKRLMRASLNKDPGKPPRQSKKLSSEERASLVQAATSVLEEAKRQNMLSYKELFLLHDHDNLYRLVRLQGSYRILWDCGDVLLDAIAAYFGTKIGFYLAWLKFYTGALVYPTLMGLLLWWTEETETEVSTEPWWKWPSAKVTTVMTAGGRNKWRSASASTSLAPYFNIFLAVWATLLMVMWKRRSSTLAFRWGVHKEDTIERAKYMARWTHKSGRNHQHRKTTITATDRIKGLVNRPMVDECRPSSHTDHEAFSHKADNATLRRRCAKGVFRARAGEAAAAAIKGGKLGVLRLDGLEEFRLWDPLRTARLLVSWVLEAVMLYLAIRMMLWFAWFEQFGGGFNVHLVRIASVIIPTTFFGIHAKWTQAMTAWEGHATNAGAENSLIVKHFTFRCVNSFSRLFYLGFWQRDLVGLQQMLVTALITKAFMDVLKEIMTPYIQVYLRKRVQRAEMRESAGVVGGDVHAAPPPSTELLHLRQQRQHSRLFHCMAASVQQRPEVACRVMELARSNPEKKQMWREALTNERMLPEYEVQGKYLDIMVQYGYVTMFAVAFPLAPLLALVRCLAEMYINHRKLLRCRRPPYVDRSGISACYGILDFMGMASVLTNCILIGLTAEARRLYIPIPLANQFPHSKYIVMAVFVEHMILGVKAAVRVLIDDVPDGVELAIAEELLHDQDETRRKVEGTLGLEEDVEATQVTIVRQQHEMTAEGPLSHSFNSSQAPLEINDQSLHSNDSLPPSSVHMMSSGRFPEAGAASTRRRRRRPHPPFSLVSS